jgi:hypothetical protein
LKRLRREGVKLDARGRVRPAKRAKSIDEEVWGGP